MSAAPLSSAVQSDLLTQVRDQVKRRWRECYEYADDADEDGSPVGVATYYRNVARGLGEALVMIDTALAAVQEDGG